MLKKLLLTIAMTISLHANLFQEEDKQQHIQASVPFGMMGALVCKGENGFGLVGWEAILCGTAIGIIPGVAKEALDQKEYGGWDNRDLLADGIGSFIGSFGTVVIWEFRSGEW